MRITDFRHDLLPLSDRLFRLAYSIVQHREEAEDIVEDTLIKIWERREELGELRSIESYSFTIRKNMSLDRIEKKEMQNIPLDIETNDCADATYGPDIQLEQSEQLQIIQQLFNHLPPTQRMVMQLRDIEGKTTAETAEILNITPANVKVLLLRARQYIRAEIEKIDNHGL